MAVEYPLRDFARSLSHGGGKEYVIAQVIPSHGLKRIVSLFCDTTAISIPDKLNHVDSRYWGQIHSAFEVRHLIEHRKGKVDGRFKTEVVSKNLWKNSSWGELTEEINSGRMARMEVREKDFEETFAAMVESTTIITQATMEYRLE